jgi:hypothetical protein
VFRRRSGQRRHGVEPAIEQVGLGRSHRVAFSRSSRRCCRFRRARSRWLPPRT